MDILASGGNPEPPTWSRIMWASLEGIAAIALLIAGGLGALQTTAIIIALPFSVVMLAMCYSTWKAFQVERALIVHIQRRLQRDEFTEHVSRNLREGGLINDLETEVFRALGHFW